MIFFFESCIVVILWPHSMTPVAVWIREQHSHLMAQSLVPLWRNYLIHLTKELITLKTYSHEGPILLIRVNYDSSMGK